MRIDVEIREVDLDGNYGRSVIGVRGTCTRCGHTVESFGTGDNSKNRILAVMREECENEENNFYAEE